MLLKWWKCKRNNKEAAAMLRRLLNADEKGLPELKIQYVKPIPGEAAKKQDTEELIEKYGNRYAFEWFMRAQDNFYFNKSKGYTDAKCKKITALAVTNAVITVVLATLILCKRPKK